MRQYDSKPIDILDARVQLGDRLFSFWLIRRHLAQEPGGRVLHVIAGATDSINEWLLVACEATVQEHADVELLGGRILLGLSAPGF